MPTPRFMVLIGCCPEMLFPISPSISEQARLKANPGSHEHLTQQRVSSLRHTTRLLAHHCEIHGHNRAVSRMVEVREISYWTMCSAAAGRPQAKVARRSKSLWVCMIPSTVA
jgi:hypothetical protein